MPRIARHNYISNYFHIMVQGINKEYIFQKDEFKAIYLKNLKNKIIDTDIKLIAYCIMDNHVHMLMFSEVIDNISKTMASVNTKYAKFYNKVMNRVGYVFKNRFKSEMIMDRRHLENCIKYIHNNPVKANICKKQSEYIYSSYNDYLKLQIDKKIINLLCDGKIENIGGLLDNKVEYDFIDVKEKIEYESPEIVLKEYKDYEYMNQRGIYIIIRDIKKRCNIEDSEIWKLLNLKRSTFYNILRKYRGNKNGT